MNAQTKHPIHGSIDAAACLQGENVARLIRVLDRIRPDGMKAIRAMEIIGIPFGLRHSWTGEGPNGSPGYVIEPHSAYVSFACIAARANAVLRRHGWALCRTGGAYNDMIWIAEQDSDHRLN
jgi:hypothetical protein